MHILFVTPYPPYPPESGGKIRTYNLVREVAKLHDVTLFTLADAGDEKEMIDHLSQFVRAVEVYYVEPMSWLQKKMHPDIYRHFHSPGLKKRLAEVIAQGGIDLIHVEELVMSKVLPPTDIPHVLGRQKIDIYFLKQVYESDLRIRKIKWQSDLVKLLRQEKRAKKHFDGEVLCSKVDMHRLRTITGEMPHCIVPNGVDLEYFAPQDPVPDAERTAGKRSLVFTGSMDYEPNVDGAQYFVEDILPDIHEKMPDVEVYFVGHRPTPEVQALGETPGVTVTGSVDDVRPYIRDASVVICPIRIGEGTRLKILEAMSMKKPVVSTVPGAEGLAVKDGDHIRIGRKAEDFAAATLALLESEEEADRIAEGGYRVVHERYGWPAIAARMAEFYESLVSKRSD